MPFTHPRMRRERQTLQAMVAIYCRDLHHPAPQALCARCQALCDYALERLDRCPFQENKSTCVNCAVHCYQREIREQVREVMRYAGPRMLLRHPILAIGHLVDGKRKAPTLARRKTPPEPKV